MKHEEIDQIKATLANIINNEILIHIKIMEESNRPDPWRQGFIAGIGHVTDDIINKVLDSFVEE